MTRLKLALPTLLWVFMCPVLLLASEDSPRSITVNGHAELQVVPDEVVLNLGVETHDEDLAEAKRINDGKLQALIKAAKEHGIEERHLVTDYLSISPRYKNRYQSDEQIGFLVRRTLSVTLRQVDRFESLLAAAMKVGANHVHGIQFRTTELRKHRDKARDLALDAAREKATDMASRLGETLGRPLTIQEGYANWSSPYSRWWGGGGNSMSQNVVQVEPGGSGGSDGPTTPGQISVTARVSVTFELAD